MFRCNLTRDGKEALIKLSKGDMRRALNVLQACHAAYDRIDEVAVYNCTGNPLPADVENIVDTMMNAEFTAAYKREQTPAVSLAEAKGVLTSIVCPLLYPNRRLGPQSSKGDGTGGHGQWDIRLHSNIQTTGSESHLPLGSAGANRVSLELSSFWGDYLAVLTRGALLLVLDTD
jgi:hypothetical protein